MITQIFHQGTHEIKIESAESLEDAKANNFKEGEHARFYVNGKLTDNYMAMIKFIISESKENESLLIPTGPSLMKTREEMFNRRNKAIYDRLETIKNQYGQMGLPIDVLGEANKFLNKIDPLGIRIKE